jgi:hypothetical protein
MAIALLAEGERLAGWWQFVWPVITITWALFVLAERRTSELNRETIQIQKRALGRYEALFSQAMRDAGPSN